MRAAVDLALGVVVLAVLVLAFLAAGEFAEAARWFPRYISAAGIVLAAISLGHDIRKTVGDKGTQSTAQSLALRQAAYWLAWLVGYLCLVLLIGMVWATALWLVSFLRSQARASWVFTAASVAAVLLALYVLGTVLDVSWPAGILAS